MLPLTPHICQSKQWGQFKSLVGSPAIQVGGVQFTVHRIPKTPWSIGYAPRTKPDQIDYKALYLAGQRNNCLYIKIEPNAVAGTYITPSNCRPSKAVFAPQTILLDLTPSEDDLQASMHPKTRYNLNLAQRKGVRVVVSESEKDVTEFIKLQKETAARQKFFLHPDSYYRTVFKSLHPEGMAYLLLAQIANPTNEREPDITIAAWMLFRYGDTLYYPYGGSSYEHRQLMASSLLMWEAIRLGKKLGCRVFDMWGACTDPADPWYGFTRFKLGFGGKIVDFAPTFDLVVNPLLYPLITKADKLRWLLLKTLKKIT